MTAPLMVLALLAAIGGYVGVPVAFGGHNEFEHFLAPVFTAYSSGQPTPEPSAPAYQAISLTAIAVFAFALGLLTAYVFYCRKPGRATELARRFKSLYSLLAHKYWVDEIYGALIVSPLLFASRWILGGLVDTGIVGGVQAPQLRVSQREFKRNHAPHAVWQHSLVRWLARAGRSRRHLHRPVRSSPVPPMILLSLYHSAAKRKESACLEPHEL